MPKLTMCAFCILSKIITDNLNDLMQLYIYNMFYHPEKIKNIFMKVINSVKKTIILFRNTTRIFFHLEHFLTNKMISI